MTEMKQNVETLIKKSADAHSSNDAMKFSQAALNAANAICSLETANNISHKD